jgi:plasmid stabilization system protein ParE
MSLPVVMSAKAHLDIEACCSWWAEHRSVEQTELWYDVCYATLRSLTERAETCPLAAESHELSVEARQIAFGVGRKPTHRAVFTIRPDMIFVLRVQHLAQRALTIDDL